MKNTIAAVIIAGTLLAECASPDPPGPTTSPTEGARCDPSTGR